MMVMRLIDKTDGKIEFDREDIDAIPAREFATLPARKRIQMVFQDPTRQPQSALHRRAPLRTRCCGSAM
jgi:ABC-type oligopeptide transport system ATPase subunit